MRRTPNTICKICKSLFYKRPKQKEESQNHFCSRKCFAKYKTKPNSNCLKCGLSFKKKRKEQKFCSLSCGSKGRPKVTKENYKNSKGKSKREVRLRILKELYNFKNCMIEGCDYNTTYDIHRFIPGKNGGEYKIGNMFAICPNHHAEITRRIAIVEKINDYTLKIIA